MASALAALCGLCAHANAVRAPGALAALRCLCGAYDDMRDAAEDAAARGAAEGLAGLWATAAAYVVLRRGDELWGELAGAAGVAASCEWLRWTERCARALRAPLARLLRRADLIGDEGLRGGEGGRGAEEPRGEAAEAAEGLSEAARGGGEHRGGGERRREPGGEAAEAEGGLHRAARGRGGHQHREPWQEAPRGEAAGASRPRATGGGEEEALHAAMRVDAMVSALPQSALQLRAALLVLPGNAAFAACSAPGARGESAEERIAGECLLLQLPPELLRLALSFLTARRLCAAAAASSALREACADQRLWFDLFVLRWPRVRVQDGAGGRRRPAPGDGGGAWRSAYERRHRKDMLRFRGRRLRTSRQGFPHRICDVLGCDVVMRSEAHARAHGDAHGGPGRRGAPEEQPREGGARKR